MNTPLNSSGFNNYWGDVFLMISPEEWEELRETDEQDVKQYRDTKSLMGGLVSSGDTE